MTHVVSSDGTGRYSDTLIPRSTGSYSIRAFYTGNSDHASAISPVVRASVRKLPPLEQIYLPLVRQ